MSELALVQAVERHEADVWARCFEAAAAIPGNPLGAVVERSSEPALGTLTALDSYEINDVVGLGVSVPVDRRLVRSLVDFYRSYGRNRFRVQLFPAAAPPELPRWLMEAGLRPVPDSTTKMWRLTDDLALLPAPSAEVRLLGLEHREAVGKLNSLAWGAAANEASVQWFGATVGSPGFHHYGVFSDSRLISTGALVVDGLLAWVGFAATHPRYRERGLRQTINSVRLAEAGRLGCRLVHVEIDGRYSSSPKLPFRRQYDRAHYAFAS